MEPERPHILFVEHDSSVARVTSFLLNDRGYRTTIADDPRVVIPLLREHVVDLVLTNIALPYIDGFSLCVMLRREHFDVPIVFLSERNRVEDRLEAFASGADDYIAIPAEPNVLMARIQAVLQRASRARRGAPKTLINVGETSLDLVRSQFSMTSGSPIPLTPTETKILECLMHNAHTVISREKLIELTSGYAGQGSSNRIDVYVRRLRIKIEANPDEPDFIHTVRGRGYVFRHCRPEVDVTSGVG